MPLTLRSPDRRLRQSLIHHPSRPPDAVVLRLSQPHSIGLALADSLCQNSKPVTVPVSLNMQQSNTLPWPLLPPPCSCARLTALPRFSTGMLGDVVDSRVSDTANVPEIGSRKTELRAPASALFAANTTRHFQTLGFTRLPINYTPPRTVASDTFLRRLELSLTKQAGRRPASRCSVQHHPSVLHWIWHFCTSAPVPVDTLPDLAIKGSSIVWLLRLILPCSFSDLPYTQSSRCGLWPVRHLMAQASP